MRFVEIWDYTAHIESFYLKNGVATSFKTKEPYKYKHAISSECWLQGPIYPWIFDDGSYFINLEEYDGVPPYDDSVDMVLYANERVGLMDEYYEKYSVDSIRKQFPNAVIVGLIKEVAHNFNSGDASSDIPRRQVRPERPKNRIRFFNDCDHVLMPTIPNGNCSKIEYIKKLQSDINKEITYIPGPVNTEYVFKNYFNGFKQNSIFAYLPLQHQRRGLTYQFASYIGNKYNLPVYAKNLDGTQPFDYLSSHDFVNLWSPHNYHFNLDPLESQPGQQCKQVASVGSINIGGVNDSHKFLYPETATNDLEVLEDAFVSYHENEEKRLQVMQNAIDKINQLCGFEIIKGQFVDRFKND